MNTEERQHLLNASKYGDDELPEFSKEVPTASKKHEKGGDTTVDYKWNKSDSPIIRIQRIVYRKGEKLDELYRVAARDGADSVCFVYGNTTYIIRKTAKEIAIALYSAYGKIKGAIESIVGYFQTFLGSEYIVSKIDEEAWAFDKRIAKGNINYVEADSLDTTSKGRLCELITEKISELHSTNLILGRFTLNNVLLTENDMKFTDLRKLRVSRKRSFVIEEFINMMQYLFAIGIASRDDIYYSIAYYTAENEDSSNDWHKEKKGTRTTEHAELVHAIEQEIYS